MLPNLKARAEKSLFKSSITVYLYEKLSGGKISYLSGFQFRDIEEGEAVDPSEVLELSYQTCQELMDSLWDCGLRPSEGSGSAGSLMATENHLKDLQEFSKRLLSLAEHAATRKESNEWSR